MLSGSGKKCIKSHVHENEVAIQYIGITNYPNVLGPRGVQITETIQFVYKAEHFPFNAQQNIYEYH